MCLEVAEAGETAPNTSRFRGKMSEKSTRERVTEIIADGRERAIASWKVADEIVDSIPAAHTGNHCCECCRREDAWDKLEGMASVALGVLSEANTPAVDLRNAAVEYLLSFFRVNSALEMPKF